MRIDKAQLVEILRARGDHDLADRANLQLPAQIESAEHPEFFRGLELDVDAGDAARHAGAGEQEEMSGLATSDD
jgi:hypothetical protein